jgi:ubiquinone/menaquinone biosynthesis C-methylase UbiE
MTEHLNSDEKDVFQDKLIDILNKGALNLAMGIGYRVGLFEALDSFDAPASAGEIAQKAGLSQRYVQEWLGAMATGDIVALSKSDEGKNLFFLPKGHADYLTKRAGNNNIGVYTQETPLLSACAFPNVVDDFTQGNGLPYSCYDHFHAFMSELADAKHHQVLVQTFLPSVDNGNLLEKLKSGIRVCDIGCGEGVALLLMAQAFPNSSFIGIDISKEAIHCGKEKIKSKNIHNADFLVKDAAALSADNQYGASFHYITAFDAIHDQTQPAAVLKSIRHILRSEGIFSMVDIAARTDMSENLNDPMGPFLYTVSLMHCMPVGLWNGGTGLGMMWGREKALQMLKDAGFSNVSVESIPEDTFNDHFLCRK